MRASFGHRAIVFALAASLVGGCVGDEGSSRVVASGSMWAAAPESLVVLAQEVRAGGGVVLMGHISGEISEAGAERVPALSDVWVEYPMNAAQLLIDDALGETIDATTEVRARRGAARLTDVEGQPAEGWVMEDAEDPLAAQRTLVPGGRILFLRPRAYAPSDLLWSASVSNGDVDGTGTTGGAVISLELLRR